MDSLKACLFIVAFCTMALIAPQASFAVELIDDSNSLSELLLVSASDESSDCEPVSAPAGLDNSVELQSEPSFTISGPDAVTTNSTAQYAAEGASGPVTWSVTGNFGTGGGISQSGKLTIGPNACGAVKVTAYSQGIAVTKEVRVNNGGQWVEIDRCGPTRRVC